MENENPASAEQQASETLSLEDVYKEAGIEEAQPQTQAAPVQQVAPAQVQAPQMQQPAIPDPYDQDAYRAFMANMVQNQTALNASLQEFRGRQSQIEQQTALQKLEEDISSATDFVSKEAGIENTALAHFELNERARTDSRFKQLWENRNGTPANKAALQKALTVISKEISKKYDVRTDPQLLANRRALKASQQSSATTETDDSGDSNMGTLIGADFQRAWDQMVRQNN